ncbi:MAG TPA: helix-turn-helix domain-containing protein [Candidatus Gemmiger avium]|nr:helix-turn-helix domain-containing protein [Candidatus Gemmiger avium]
MAAYLCFPSQSRFGEVFKQFTGTTPKKYREQSM